MCISTFVGVFFFLMLCSLFHIVSDTCMPLLKGLCNRHFPQYQEMWCAGGCTACVTVWRTRMKRSWRRTMDTTACSAVQRQEKLDHVSYQTHILTALHRHSDLHGQSDDPNRHFWGCLIPCDARKSGGTWGCHFRDFSWTGCPINYQGSCGFHQRVKLHFCFWIFRICKPENCTLKNS